MKKTLQTCLRWLRTNLSLFLLLGYAFVLVYFFWAYNFQGNPPAVIDPLTTDKTEYMPGEIMHVSTHICKDKVFPFTSYRTFENDLVYGTSPEFLGGISPGCADITIPELIPLELPPGRYQYTVRNVYEVNPYVERQLFITSNFFDILPLPSQD